ncbi:MAG: hypothetical protein K5785_01020 [Nitrosarchaeum sp.]|nr:hypothetical protein [Nitrosarchaeum sp.]
MATIPAGYDPTGLSPKIQIIDENDTVQYTYESDQIAESPEQDFDLESWNLYRGVNTEHGNCVIVIDDPDKDLLDLTDARRESKIKGTWMLKMFLGKNSTNVNEWFRGYILGNDPNFPDPGETKHRIIAYGESIKTAYYKTIMRFFQKKEADGETLDATDADAKLSEIFKRLILNTDHLAVPGMPSLGFTVNGVQDMDIKIPDFQKNFDSIGQACNELAGIGSAYYGVELGDAYLRRRDSVDSGFLVTNMDYDNIIKTNWNQDKVAYLLNAPRGWSNDFSDYGIGFFNGLNTQKPIKDQEQTSANAALNLSSKHISFPIIPGRDNVLKIAPFLAKVGTISKDLTVKICGDDGTGKPNPEDIRVKKIIKGGQLQNELASAKYFEILFNKFSVLPATTIHCVIDKFADAVNYITLDYQTGTGTYHDSDDGIAWTARTGDIKFREYAAKTTHVLCENTVASKKFAGMKRQMNVPMTNFKSNEMALVALAGIATSRGKQRRRYPSFMVSAPTLPLHLGKTFRYIDIRTGLQFQPNLISYELGGSAYDKQSNLGATEISLTMEEWGY